MCGQVALPGTPTPLSNTEMCLYASTLPRLISEQSATKLAVCTGHDDTLWMIDNVLKLLEGLDPEQPQVITDNIWFSPEGKGVKLSHHLF